MIITTPEPLQQTDKATVFLAGSIEQGVAENWQATVGNFVTTSGGVAFNPRRENWDATVTQSPSDPLFSQQVKWELQAMEQADIIFFYFQPGTMSPVSMLELGLALGNRRRVVVCCPPGFWRGGNIEITCNRCGIRVHDNLSDALLALEVVMNSVTAWRPLQPV